MQGDIDKVLISKGELARRVRELAADITEDHASADKDGGITIVPILTGAMIFCADLMRQIPIAMKIGLMGVSSYPGRSVRSQGPEILASQLGDIRGRHVLVIDDVLDSGGTLGMVLPVIKDLGAASVKACVLLRKDRPSAREVRVDYVGFEIPDVFVVGYGLDYNNFYRNLPDVVTLRAAAMEKLV
jgi:hypoxanthine phosphoribosyltransferase